MNIPDSVLLSSLTVIKNGTLPTPSSKSFSSTVYSKADKAHNFLLVIHMNFYVADLSFPGDRVGIKAHQGISTVTY